MSSQEERLERLDLQPWHQHDFANRIRSISKTMTHKIRPFTFTDTDYHAAVNLRNTLYPDIQTTVEIWKHNDQSRRKDPSYYFFVAEGLNGNILAFAQCSKTNPTSYKFSVGIVGRPETWSNEVANDLLQAVKTAAADHQSAALVLKVQESDTHKLNFLIAQRFKKIMRYPLSALKVASFDAAHFKDKVAQAAASGITVSQMPPSWHLSPKQQKFIHELDWQLMLDVPHHEAREKKSLELFLADEVFHPNAFPESYFIAWDNNQNNQAVGMTCFVKRGGKVEAISTAITGVMRSHRRKGIATALKTASIEFAKTVGCQTVITNNEENNPMYLINQQLGFEARPAWLDMELDLT
ncbi:MAG: mycothiol synthase [Candidatus Promineifilaceae bacterium]|jgi:mycothiol synthase